MKWNAISEEDLATAGELEAAFPVTAGGPEAMRVIRPQANPVVVPRLSTAAFKTRKANRSLSKTALKKRARRYNCA